jgi:hypothetical protein
MNAILYPVAANAEAALATPLGRAAREREARDLAQGEVEFCAEEVGPAFPTRDAALDAFPGRLEDDRAGRTVSLPPEERFLSLRQVAVRQGGRVPVRPPVAPVFEDGRRWPQGGPPAVPVAWRLSNSYWRLVAPEGAVETAPGQARLARKKPEAATFAPDRLRAMTREPLRPVKPQQALDIGLFETPLPEAPDRLIADE